MKREGSVKLPPFYALKKRHTGVRTVKSKAVVRIVIKWN